MSVELSPEDRARAAVESLSAEGVPVTARSVRERAGVRMTVAAEAARLHAEEAAAAVQVPEMPEAVAARADALWRAAVIAARAELEAERDGWMVKLDQAAGEVKVGLDEIQRLEDLVEELRAELAERARAQSEAAAAAAAELAEQRSLADRADAVAGAVREERDRVIAERDELRARLDAVPPAQAK